MTVEVNRVCVLEEQWKAFEVELALEQGHAKLRRSTGFNKVAS
jgi:hypothetical protein